MKVIILAGGLGTRISEETENKPKPMVLLDDKPILWHLMNTYAVQGFTDFVIATGYMNHVIDSWVESLESPWTIQTVFTGKGTQTGGRIKKCMSQFPGERVLATYGDGLGSVDIKKLLSFHEKCQLWATVTAVRPPARFGVLSISGDLVDHFGETHKNLKISSFSAQWILAADGHPSREKYSERVRSQGSTTVVRFLISHLENNESSFTSFD
jgi:glucose-1-phosphate cytidylyltransferase